MIFRKKRDPEDRPVFGTHPGDLGVIVVAAIITIAFVALLLTPRNFTAFYKALAPDSAPKARTEPVTPGVTSMQLYDVPDKDKKK